MRNAREVDANLAHCRAAVPADLWAELKQEGLIAAGAPVPDAARTPRLSGEETAR